MARDKLHSTNSIITDGEEAMAADVLKHGVTTEKGSVGGGVVGDSMSLSRT